MKTTTLVRNGISMEMVSLISRLVEMIPWPARRCAMGDVTLSLLDGKHRVAESVFGWSHALTHNSFSMNRSHMLDPFDKIPDALEAQP